MFHYNLHVDSGCFSINFRLDAGGVSKPGGVNSPSDGQINSAFVRGGIGDASCSICSLYNIASSCDGRDNEKNLETVITLSADREESPLSDGLITTISKQSLKHLSGGQVSFYQYSID